jgi:hypothetical protein
MRSRDRFALVALFALGLGGCATTRIECHDGRPEVSLQTLLRHADLVAECPVPADGAEALLTISHGSISPGFWQWLKTRPLRGVLKRDNPPPAPPPPPPESPEPAPQSAPPRWLTIDAWQWTELRCGGVLAPLWCP